MAVDLAGPAPGPGELLDGWDGSQGIDSAPAAYFNAVWRHLLRLTFHDDLPERAWPSGGDRWYEVVGRLLDTPDDPFWDDVTTEGRTEGRDDILRQAMAAAYQELSGLLGHGRQGVALGRPAPAHPHQRLPRHVGDRADRGAVQPGPAVGAGRQGRGQRHRLGRPEGLRGHLGARPCG